MQRGFDHVNLKMMCRNECAGRPTLVGDSSTPSRHIANIRPSQACKGATRIQGSATYLLKPSPHVTGLSQMMPHGAVDISTSTAIKTLLRALSKFFTRHVDVDALIRYDWSELVPTTFFHPCRALTNWQRITAEESGALIVG